MSDSFFRDLNLPAPHFHLEVGSGTSAEQMGGVMMAYEKVAVREAGLDRGLVGDSANRRQRARWSAPSSGSRSFTSRRDCAAVTAACPKRSTAW